MWFNLLLFLTYKISSHVKTLLSHMSFNELWALRCAFLLYVKFKSNIFKLKVLTFEMRLFESQRFYSIINICCKIIWDKFFKLINNKLKQFPKWLINMFMGLITRILYNESLLLHEFCNLRESRAISIFFIMSKFSG